MPSTKRREVAAASNTCGNARVCCSTCKAALISGAAARARGVAAPRRPSRPNSGSSDRKSVVWGKSVSVRVDLGGLRSITTKKQNEQTEERENTDNSTHK